MDLSPDTPFNEIDEKKSESHPGLLLSINLAKVLEAVLCFRNLCVAKRKKLGWRTRFNHARGLRCAWRWWLTDVVGLQVGLGVVERGGLGVVERGGHDLKLFGNPPKIFKLGLIVGDKSPTIISRLTHPQPDLPPDERTAHQRQSANHPGSF
ncbi:hypothetical protein [Lapidilactobacillus achengensis]|uniref:hypothetical protein n=1 Tax=Lapidilactobacillus achengensis TaxID=2486000 RepID=UPI000F7B0371|nr:hypothetical protein [Lapidilactobacillus achengensis]